MIGFIRSRCCKAAGDKSGFLKARSLLAKRCAVGAGVGLGVSSKSRCEACIGSIFVALGVRGLGGLRSGGLVTA